MKYLYSMPKLFSITAFIISMGLFTAWSQKKTNPKTEKNSEQVQTVFADTTKKELVAAPDFTLQNSKGKSFTLSDHKGEVIVLNIWATWCPPCRREIPDFIEIQKELKNKNVLFVGVSVDEKGWPAVKPFIKKYEVNYPVVLDDGTVYGKYGPFRGIPTTFIINKEGKIRYATTGMIRGEALKPVLEKLADQ